jgi:hypothetical protein
MESASNGYDIETGNPANERFTPVTTVPADPARFSRYNLERVQRSLSGSLPSKEETERVFSQPTPEERQIEENRKMFYEDPLYADPFQQEPLEVWKK